MPRRRCVGCGRVAPKSELLRIVASDRRCADASPDGRTYAVADPSAQMPGRGAYLCLDAASSRPAVECLSRATQRGGIARALRRSIAAGPAFGESEPVESVNE